MSIVHEKFSLKLFKSPSRLVFSFVAKATANATQWQASQLNGEEIRTLSSNNWKPWFILEGLPASLSDQAMASFLVMLRRRKNIEPGTDIGEIGRTVNVAGVDNRARSWGKA